MFKQLRNILLNILFITLLLLLNGCSNMLVLLPKGVIAADEKSLLITSIFLMSLVVIPVILLTLIFAWKYRESNLQAMYSPNWADNTLLEIVWWTIPCIIILILAILTWNSAHKLDPFRPLATGEKPLTIEAVALDWKWLFIYPEQNIATINFVKIPINQPINFLITADAPMNSFQVPQLGGQIYAMSGMKTQLHLLATHPGNFYGYSANFSGEGFATMNFEVSAGTTAEFENWVNSVKQSPNKLSMVVYNQLALPSSNNPVTYYSDVNAHLFHAIIMKYMLPNVSQLKGNQK